MTVVFHLFEFFDLDNPYRPTGQMRKSDKTTSQFLSYHFGAKGLEFILQYNYLVRFKIDLVKL
jgi:hypothetical protein